MERQLVVEFDEAVVGIERLPMHAIELGSEPALSFLWRHRTQDVTMNHTPEAGLAEIATPPAARRPELLAQVAEIKRFYGLREQRLEQLLVG